MLHLHVMPTHEGNGSLHMAKVDHLPIYGLFDIYTNIEEIKRGLMAMPYA